VKACRQIAIALALVVAASVQGCGDAVESDECQAEIDDWREALDDANETIEQLNATIENAQGYAGSSYSEMREALESMEVADTVNEP
jgi:hypothetical protein